MHLLKGQPRGLNAGAEPVDLEQSPGDIVILSAADTEISGLAAARRSLGDAFPSVRLANWMQLGHPYSVDLYGEKVLAHARLVVIRLLGGASYWRYGLDEAVRLARANGTKLVVLPGDATWDGALSAEGTAGEEIARKLFAYFVEGGSTNLANALRYCAHLIGHGEEPPEAQPLPSAGIYTPRSADARQPSPLAGEGGVRPRPDLGRGGRAALAAAPVLRRPPHQSAPRTASPARGEAEPAPVAAVVFYRALVQAGQTEPVDALCAALRERGLRPLPVFVSSLKAKEDAAFVAAAFAEHDPALVLNATAFALSAPGTEFAGTVLDGRDRPVLQVTFAGVLRGGMGGERAWPVADRPHHERRSAGGGRADHFARGVLQGGGRARPAHRVPPRPLPAEGGPRRLRGGACGALGAAAGEAERREAGRDRALQLPEPRRPPRQRRRPRRAGLHRERAEGDARGRLCGGRCARERRGADGAAARRPDECT